MSRLARASEEATVVRDCSAGRSRSDAPPRLVVMTGPRAGAELALTGSEVTLGRGSDNALVLPDISVSRRHALVRCEWNGYVLLDRGSGNGTRVNGREVERARLKGGDQIALGDSVVEFVERGAVAVRSGARAVALAVPRAEQPRVARGGPRGVRALTPAAITLLVLAGLGAVLWRGHPREAAATRTVAPQRLAEHVKVAQPPAEAAHADAREQPGAAPVPVRTGSRRKSASAARPAELAAIVEAYLAGDVGAAIERARAAQRDARALRMLKELQAFDAAYREAAAEIQAKRTHEAIRALERARTADRALAEGKQGWLGVEVRRALSNQHTQLALAQTSDDQLAGSASHLRAAVDADPGNGVAKVQLELAAGRVREIYLRGYLAKDGDPEAARRDLRLVADALPADDETGQKARRWLDRLDGKPPEDGR